tara:strand:- start:21 stop:461 length:441 start_codon:yes stop_codon:yes gene_type:complete
MEYIIGALVVFFLIYKLSTRGLKRVSNEISIRLEIDERTVRRMISNLEASHAQTFFKYYDRLKKQNTELASRLIFINEMVRTPDLPYLASLAKNFKNNGYDCQYSSSQIFDAVSHFKHIPPQNFQDVKAQYFEIMESPEYKSQLEC